MGEPRNVIAFGEALWDLLPGGPVLGGAPVNFAYRVNSLGDRGIVVSRLGQDELGRQALERFSALGMPTDALQWDEDLPTGTVEVTLDAGGHPDFRILPGVAYDHIELTPLLLDLVESADCIEFGTLSQRCETSARTLYALLDAAPARVLKVLDINLRKECYSRRTVEASLARASVLKLNEDEIGVISRMFGDPPGSPTDFCSRALHRWPLTHCVVTLGEAGVFAASRAGEQVHVPGYTVDVVDTVGSGDAFTAGWVYQALRQQPLEECCRFGNALGALAASRPGGTAPISSNDIEDIRRKV